MGVQELLVLILVIVVLSMTGLWPQVVRGLRELRGERVDDADTPNRPPPAGPNDDLTVSCQLLGVSPSASWEEVERAYRAKAKRHHPDHGGDEDAMRALNDAYARLRRLHGKR